MELDGTRLFSTREVRLFPLTPFRLLKIKKRIKMFTNFSIICLIYSALMLTSVIESKLSPETVAASDDKQHFDRVLQNIIQPRVVGTPGHEIVKNFIINELTALNFDVELDAFSERVPIFRNVTFTNIIGKLNKNAKKYLTLSCHYDSKYFPDQIFQGAVDSAVPCSIMLNVVKTLLPALATIRNREDISLMLIFFDGEEAIQDWTRTDSLYGSRHLAKKWSTSLAGKGQSQELDKIEVMVLLDLIGAAQPLFFSYFENTDIVHARLVEIERLLAKSKLLHGRNYMFLERSGDAGIDDDHRPFLDLNVPILHVIAVPFPRQWHKLTDNLRNLHYPTIQNFIRIFRVFVIDYLTEHQPNTNYRDII